MQAEARATAPEAARPRSLPELEPQLDELLHVGELTDVWRAVAAPSRSVAGRSIALKMLQPRWLDHPGAVALLRREHRALARLRHPSIVETFGYVERSDRCAVSLEYVPCGDLVPLAGAEPRHWTGLVLDVVDALGHVHACGLVHGDVKARNVLIAATGHAKLVDFGSSVEIGQPLLRGGRTAAHLPRDVRLARRIAAESAQAGPALDVYALAVLLYELLSGRLPPEGDRAAGDLPRPLRGIHGDDAIAALAERVLETLSATTEAGVGTLTAFRNVLESVHSRNVDGSD